MAARQWHVACLSCLARRAARTVHLGVADAGAFPDRICHASPFTRGRRHYLRCRGFRGRSGGLHVRAHHRSRRFDTLETDWNDLFCRARRGGEISKPSIGTGTGAISTSPHLRSGCPFARDRYRAPRSTPGHGAATHHRARGRAFAARVDGRSGRQYRDILVEPEAVPLLAKRGASLPDELKPDLVRLRKVRDDAAIGRSATSARFGRAPAAPYLGLAGAPDFATFERRYSPRRAATVAGSRRVESSARSRSSAAAGERGHASLRSRPSN